MQEINVYDGSGNYLTDLVQWDKDVLIHIQHPDILQAYNVHFFNSSCEEALVVTSTYSDGDLRVRIPNELLTYSLPITGYVYIIEGDESKSLYGFRLMVRKRPRPSNYIYVESEDYISLEKVLEECRIFANNALNSENNAQGFAIEAESFAHGGTGTRPNEEQDNARYYSVISQEEADKSLKSAKDSESSNLSASGYAGTALAAASDAQNYAVNAKEYADQVAIDKQEIDETIKNSLLDKSEEIINAMEDYFKRAEELYRSCTIVCDGEIPARRVRTIVEINCHTPQRRATGYIGIDFDGGTPEIRLLGE